MVELDLVQEDKVVLEQLTLEVVLVEDLVILLIIAQQVLLVLR